MGIRIRKDIGYFIPIEKYENFIVKNLSELIEDIDYQGEQYLRKMIESYKNYKPQSKKTHEDMFLPILAKAYENKEIKFEAYNVVREVCFGDTVVGLIVQTPELYQKSRYDDLIDYYENNPEDSINSIKYLNKPIYPMQGYIYTGGLENKFPNLEKGEICNMFHISSLYLKESQSLADNKKHGFICQSGHFRPNIDAGAFLIAKEFGVLQESITEDEFNNVVEPVIITSWS